MASLWRFGASAFLFVLACASPPQQRPSPESVRSLRPPPQMPRSSVAAVLAHGQELGLDAQQIDALRSIDEALAKQLDALRGPQQKVSSSGGARREGPESFEPGIGRNPAALGGGGKRGGGHHRDGEERSNPVRKAADPEQTWDDDDTAAYLEAENVLRIDQRDRARAIAEEYREKLYEVRATRRPAQAQDAGRPPPENGHP